MNKNTIFNLSVLGLLMLTLCAMPLAVGKPWASGSCDAPETAAPVFGAPVTAAVSTDTLSTVSGIEKLLTIELVNEGDQGFTDGAVVVTVSREDRSGADATFVPVARYAAKTGIDLAPQSVQTFSYAWAIPATLPTAVYKIDADFYHGGRIYEDGSVRSLDPFGNSAKLYVKGDAASAQTSVPASLEDLGLLNVAERSQCSSDDYIYVWASVIGVAGLIMLGLARLIKGRSQGPLYQ